MSAEGATPAQQVITPELRQWIMEQARDGHEPHAVLEAMLASGWQEDVALEAMEQTLTEQLEPAVAAARAVVAIPRAAHLPDVPTERHSIHVGDRDIPVLMSMALPRVVVLGNVLSTEECDALMADARARLARSETVVHATGGSEVNEARTSEGMFFTRGENEVVARIEARLAALVNWPVERGEGLQVLRYTPGAEYKPHFDYFDPAQPGTGSVLKRGGQRVGTIVIYLNTPEEGGATVFPDAGLSVSPLAGNAVFFSYAQPVPATKTLHGGAPVLRGEKWVATKWLRQGYFE